MNAYDVTAAAVGAAGLYDLTRGHKKWGWVGIAAVPVLLYLSSEHNKKVEAEKRRTQEAIDRLS